MWFCRTLSCAAGCQPIVLYMNSSWGGYMTLFLFPLAHGCRNFLLFHRDYWNFSSPVNQVRSCHSHTGDFDSVVDIMLYLRRQDGTAAVKHHINGTKFLPPIFGKFSFVPMNDFLRLNRSTSLCVFLAANVWGSLHLYSQSQEPNIGPISVDWLTWSSASFIWAMSWSCLLHIDKIQVWESFILLRNFPAQVCWH